MRPGAEISQPLPAPLTVTAHPFGHRLDADFEPRSRSLQGGPLVNHHSRHLLSTPNQGSGILVIVHSVSSENLVARHNQLLSARSNGQPIATSQLGNRE